MGKTLQPRILMFSEIIHQKGRRNADFFTKQKPREFIISRTPWQDMLKEVLQREGEYVGYKSDLQKERKNTKKGIMKMK
jgi:hypothetical protein